MKSSELTKLAEFAADALTLLENAGPAIELKGESLTKQPSESMAVWISFVRARVGQAEEALRELARNAHTASQCAQLHEDEPDFVLLDPKNQG